MKNESKLSKETRMTWTKKIWNPIIGCTKISEGCKHCYAEVMADRICAMKNGNSPYMEVLLYPKDDYGYIDDECHGWNGGTALVEKQLKPKLGKPSLVFVGTMTDLFHTETPYIWLDRVFDVIYKHPQHTFVILTKRPQHMVEYFIDRTIPYNVWLGVSVENQAMADERIPLLLQLDPTIAFVSIEPCLGAIDLSVIHNSNQLDWVIMGGEIGSHARPMHPDWVKAIHEFCEANEITFLFKQWGEWLPNADSKFLNRGLESVVLTDNGFHYGGKVDVGSYMVKVGKKAAGHLLYGVEYFNVPKSAT
jgi:protein gp37